MFSLLDVDCKLDEWFNYGSDPYHFKLDISVQNRGLTEDVYRQLHALVMEYKNVRSWLESIIIKMQQTVNIYIGMSTISGESITVYPWQQSHVEVHGKHFISSGHRIDEVITVYPQ